MKPGEQIICVSINPGYGAENIRLGETYEISTVFPSMKTWMATLVGIEGTFDTMDFKAGAAAIVAANAERVVGLVGAE